MNFKLIFTPDKQYYEEAYGEMLSITKVKKWEPVLATVMFIVGIVFYINSGRLLSFIFSGIGAYEFYKFYNGKHRWLKDRLSSGINKQSLEIEFSKDAIKHSGPFSNGELKWTGLKSIIKTRKGILLKPETGVSIYLPFRLFENEAQIDFVFSKGVA